MIRWCHSKEKADSILERRMKTITLSNSCPSYLALKFAGNYPLIASILNPQWIPNAGISMKH